MKCNNEASVFDEKFRTYLAMHVARHGGDGEKLFKSGALRTVNHNQALKRKIVQGMQRVNLFTPSNIFVGRGASVLWDSEAHDKVIERLVRGLFFHITNRILGNRADLSVYFFQKLPEALTQECDIVSIANNNFKFWYRIADDGPYSSIWAFEFYKGHWAGGITLERTLEV